MMDVHQAMELMNSAHYGQSRKGLPVPYIVHTLRVATMVSGIPAKHYNSTLADMTIAALLHDAVEDTELTFDDLRNLATPPRALELIVGLTKTYGDHAPEDIKAQEKPLYYSRIMADPDLRLLKVLDRTDNLWDMLRLAPEDLKRRKWAAKYLVKTKAEFPPLLALPLAPQARWWFQTALELNETKYGQKEPS